jgi:hypothetical protein
LARDDVQTREGYYASEEGKSGIRTEGTAGEEVGVEAKGREGNERLAGVGGRCCSCAFWGREGMIESTRLTGFELVEGESELEEVDLSLKKDDKRKLDRGDIGC